jgi:hypothetical protein
MKVVRALMLVLALSVSAFAGNIPCDKDGNQGNGGRAAEMPHIATEIALHLLRSVLPLF